MENLANNPKKAPTGHIVLQYSLPRKRVAIEMAAKIKSANPNAEYFLINEGSNQYVMYVVQDLTTEECINIIQNLKDTGEIPENSEVTVTGDSNQYDYATIDPKGKTK